MNMNPRAKCFAYRHISALHTYETLIKLRPNIYREQTMIWGPHTHITLMSEPHTHRVLYVLCAHEHTRLHRKAREGVRE